MRPGRGITWLEPTLLRMPRPACKGLRLCVLYETHEEELTPSQPWAGLLLLCPKVSLCVQEPVEARVEMGVGALVNQKLCVSALPLEQEQRYP